LWALFVAGLEVKQCFDSRASIIGAMACVNTVLTDCFLREYAGTANGVCRALYQLFPRQGTGNED